MFSRGDTKNQSITCKFNYILKLFTPIPHIIQRTSKTSRAQNEIQCARCRNVAQRSRTYVVQLKKEILIAAGGVGVLKVLDRPQPEREEGWVSKAALIHIDPKEGWGGLGNTPGAVGEVVYILLVDADEDLPIAGAIPSN